ncbi:MAG: hypothetical protein HN778_15080 [Prolixibacteraceae bacterium]|jgi:hypothetical protein|nr:hypothetical protein [Prolixibacteraceae bacterium]MBT6765226.1 hypothetical protein [Prolixibacteraceae bacterium]MBT6998038.1 hypothetical protein [Prolixibacteraceae bacterium]MBT7396153.1 hypothetical protein [Prolixibacteraceae bacterium]
MVKIKNAKHITCQQFTDNNVGILPTINCFKFIIEEFLGDVAGMVKLAVII